MFKISLKIKFLIVFLLVFLLTSIELMAVDAQPSVSPMPSPLIFSPDSVGAKNSVPEDTRELPAVMQTIETQISSEISSEIPPEVPSEIPPEKPSDIPQTRVKPGVKLAPTAIDWRVEGGFGFKSIFQPLANYSKNFFSGPSLNVLGRKQLVSLTSHSPDEYFVQGSFDLFAKTEAQSGHFLPLLRDAFFESRNHTSQRMLKLGYFLSPMLERERSFWKAYRLGGERSGLWERYSYLKSTEAGFEYGSLRSKTQLRFGFTNADAEKSDPMIQKDVFLFWEVLPQERASFYGGLGAQKGWYEGLPLKANNKDRAFIWWGYQNPRGLQITLEGFAAKDAVDGLKKPVAEGVDLLAKAGKVVNARGAALLLGNNYEWLSQKFRLEFKIDQLDPDTDKDFTSVQSNTMLISFPDDFGEITFSVENMYLEKYHSIGHKQRSTLRLDYLVEI
jgi:hypothetical protein